MDPEAETRYADISGTGISRRIGLCHLTLILVYVHFLERVTGFVVNSVLFPMCLVFLTAKLVDAFGFGPHKRPGYPCEKVLCQPQTW